MARTARLSLATLASLIFTLFLANTAVMAQDAKKELTGIWGGTFITQHDVESVGYLNITEHANGSLTGQWGNSPNSALRIENGERVTENVVQWEASSKANQQGRYRVLATVKGYTMELKVTYTWREASNVKGLTAFSVLTRN